MRSAPVAELKTSALRRALADFQTALDERWSYRHANDADFEGAIDTLRRKVDTGIAPHRFGEELQKIVALGIDGHASVSGYELPGGGHLPFLVEPEGERFVAFAPDRTGFLAAGFPYITAIDGKPIEEWLQAAAVVVPKGSPQYVRSHCLRRLRDLDSLREAMGLPQTETVAIELTDKNGKARRKVTLAVAERSPLYGVWPRGGSRLLENNVGYLRLAAMDAAAVQEIKAWMPRFRSTAGLIVDVRDNAGGSREPLQQLYSYLARPGDPPRVFTVAAYRLHKEHRNDHLAQRFMYRADAEEWTARERAAIADFAQSFQPEWKPPQGEFSPWHYMVLDRQDEGEVYHYKTPVAVLMNAKCFSATDIFLAGLKGMPNVTLLGTPSGGGSALAQEIVLGGTPFELRLGSIVSHQADGKFFDGNGVQPDVVVEPSPEYHIGGPDNVLAEAARRILK